jgi:argininosuccinate lyase
MLDLFTGVIDTLIAHEARMSALLMASRCTASNLADVIVRESGLSFRHTYHVVARLVRNSLAASVSP